MTAPNAWCRALGIEVPTLEALRGHREANTYALLLVALLEHGAPMTLAEVAHRFEEAGIDDAPSSLRALKRCRPARPPIYRDGDAYSLEPHDQDLALWAFRLGLRGPSVPRPRPPPPVATPGTDVPLSAEELALFLQRLDSSSWSEARVALAVLDALGPRRPDEVKATVHAHLAWGFHGEVRGIGRAGSPLVVLPDGRWSIAEGAGPALETLRARVRERVALARRLAAMHAPPSAEAMASRRAEREARAAAFAKLTHALLVAYPPRAPAMVVRVDVGGHTLTTYTATTFELLRRDLARSDAIGALGVRPLLRALEFEPGERRLCELGPPQKSLRLNRAGRTLPITAAMLVQGSCGIAQPFGAPAKLAAYLAAADFTKLARRLEADAKSLYALYQYGRLHGAVRLRWGFLDESFAAPWAAADERRLHTLVSTAADEGRALEVVVGSAPGWADPWSRARTVRVERRGHLVALVGTDGEQYPLADVQAARFAAEA